jgi:ketosteroid isomerase-like protein
MSVVDGREAQKMIRIRKCLWFISIAALLGGGGATAGETAEPGADPAAVVQSFNRAVSAQDLETVLAHFAAGGVQFNLRPSHGGLQAGPLTSELEARWTMIGPVLFSATQSYTRDVSIADVHQAGDIATVWADVTTQTVLANNGETRTEQFTEVYLIVRTEAGWRIGAVADNRQPDNIALGGG